MAAEQLSRISVESTEESVNVGYGEMYGQIYDLGLEADLQASVVERRQAVVNRMGSIKEEVMRGNASDELLFEYSALENEYEKLTEYCMGAGLLV